MSSVTIGRVGWPANVHNHMSGHEACVAEASVQGKTAAGRADAQGNIQANWPQAASVNLH